MTKPFARISKPTSSIFPVTGIWITKEAAPLSANSQIALTVLRLLAESGRISRRTFDMLPYSGRNIYVYLKKLVDDGGIQISGKGKSKSYILLNRGRNALSLHNPQRYTPDIFEHGKLLARHPERSRLRGDVAAVMSLAGYAVHPDDKPALPAFTPQPPDLQYPGLQLLFHNHEPQQYGQIISNRAAFTKHLTPVNCYYDALQIKNLRDGAMNKGINYARSCGVLFTPTSLFRVYHSRDVAMRFFQTGESNFSVLLEKAFTGYVPGDNSGILVFGWEFASAVSILDNYLNRRYVPVSKGEQDSGTILGTTNLGSPLFYLPLRSEALELLRLMRFPDWRRSLMLYASAAHAGLEQTGWSYLHEGRHVYIAADLNLTNLAIVLRGMMKNPREPVTLICLPWQQDFILGLVKDYGGDQANAEIALLHDSFIGDLIDNHLEPHWG